MIKFTKLTICLMLVILLQFLFLSCSYSKNPKSINDEKTLATWLWDTSIIIDSPDIILQFLNDNNTTTLFLQIDKNLDKDYYRKFIKKANDFNISIYALDGHPEFIYTDKSEYQPFFDWLTDYQNTAQTNEKFQGIHLDVEPYLLEKWEENKDEIIPNYQNLILDATEKSKNLNLTIGFDLPFWFDSITFENNYGVGNLAEFVIMNSDEVAIMAYRNSSDEVIELSKDEVIYSENYKKKIFIAVETLPSNEGAFITFFDKPLSYFNAELEKIKSAYISSDAFNGIAIHDISGWMELK
ncbi:hypothetical protein [Clostridium sp. DL1XJH146]